ncbi:MAG TPA: serine/threonine-protein kinase [Allocoleopsis sp.]
MIHSGLILRDRYRVLKKLGEGGFCRTFEVDDGGTRKVLKVLNPERLQNREFKQKAISLFQQEAVVLSRLNHPGIPKIEPNGYFIWNRGQQEPLPCLVMEKIEGQNLQEWQSSLGNQLLPQEKAIAWLKQLLEILAQIHRQNLIHRDIKPENIMLKPNGQLVLIDFGAVREVTDTYLKRQRNNETGTAICSTGYTPPEQYEGRAVPQSDIFALGRTFVYLLTGQNPTQLYSLQTGKPNWRDSAPQVSEKFADLIDDMMALSPSGRPAIQMILHYLAVIGSSSPARALPIPPSTSTPPPKRKLLLFLPRSQSLSHPWTKAELHLTLEGHADAVKAIAISPDGQIVASGSYDKTIKLWSLRTGQLIHTLTGHTNRVTCMAISPDGEILASGSEDRTIALWSLRTGQLLSMLTGHSDKVRYIAFNPKGQTLFSIGSAIKLWAVRTGNLLGTLAGHSNSARLVTYSPDGRTCAIGSLDGTLELWNPHNGKRLRSFATRTYGITAVAFSPDGEMLASGSGTTIDLWNPQTGQRLNSLCSQSEGVKSIAFSPDGQTLASGNCTTSTSSGKPIELWNLRKGKYLRALLGHQNTVGSVAFSPDGHVLVSGSDDRTIKIWRSVNGGSKESR